jgi:divalent metal cation (Fe/Co/Zn/Cd) transporter
MIDSQDRLGRPVPQTASVRASLLRRGLRLEYATLSWNVIGVVVVFMAAFDAGSVALAGFGLDSAVEILASTVVIWNLKDTAGSRERPAMLVLAYAFCGLAIYVTAQAVYSFAANSEPQSSSLGIAWTAATLIAMIALARAKGETGRALGNPVLVTESRVTLIDAYLAGAVLVGLLLNAVAGWWWADPLAGLVVVYYAAREAHKAFSEAANGRQI